MKKKINVIFVSIFLCLALIVTLSSTLGMALAVNPLSVQAAANVGSTLFDKDGNYAVSRTAIIKGKVFNFFGYDWKVVHINNDENIATFWMVTPFTVSQFVDQKASGSQQNKDNTWHNGYTESVWHGLGLGESTVRTYLNTAATQIIDKYNYKDKVRAGYVAGSNSSEADEGVAKHKVSRLQDVFYSNSSLTDLEREENGEMTINYDLSADSDYDRLWLPSVEEVMDNGLWKLDNSYRNWSDTSTANLAWLRTPGTYNNKFYSYMGMLVGYKADLFGTTNTNSIYSLPVDKSKNYRYGDNNINCNCGVRPAIHLNIASADPSVANGNLRNDGWFTDDMMKVFFIIVCVVGVIGIILVTVAVIKKNREKKAA